MTLTDDMVIALIIGVGAPLLLWSLRMYWMTHRILNLHLPPEVDEGGFGTKEIAEKLEAQTAMIDRSLSQSLASNNALKHSIRELSHYVRWDTKERTGNTPPPYVRNGD